MELRPEIISEKLRIGRMRWGVRQVLAVPRGRLFSRSGAFYKPLCYGTADLPQTLKCFSRFSYFSEMKRSRSIRKCEINIYKLIGQSAWRRCSRSGSKRRSCARVRSVPEDGKYVSPNQHRTGWHLGIWPEAVPRQLCGRLRSGELESRSL